MKLNKRNLWLDYIPMALTAGLIICFAVIKKQTFLCVLPTLITLVVQILLARANRAAFLLGGANSLLYALSYAGNHLYFQSFFAVAVSAPIQVYSYFNWRKNSVGGRPDIRELPIGGKALSVLSVIALWLACYHLLGEAIGGEHTVLDSLIFSIGVTVTVLSAFRILDAQYLSLVSSTISLILWAVICIKSPENANYFIISVYNLFRGVETLIGWRRCSTDKKTAKIILKGEKHENKSYS